MKEWREDAQPDWPEVPSAPWERPRTGGHTRPFPEPGDVLGGAFPATGTPRGGRAARTDADGTAVLPRARDDRGAADFRRAPDRGAAPAPDPEQTTVLRRVRAGRYAGPGTAEPLRHPWDEPLPAVPAQPTGDDPTHDPHEVTVQMDAVRLGGGRPAAGTAHGTGRESADGPVFVDESGRRGRTFRRLGMIVGLACAGYAVIIVATLFSGTSDAPWVPVPGQDEDAPASQVNTPPLPSVSADPTPESSGPGTGPVGSPAASGGAVPGSASRSSPAAGPSHTSADAAPTASTSADSAVVGGTRHPSASAASPAGSSPAPSAPSSGASPGPSLSPAGGTGPEAHGGVDPTSPRPHL
ncbi:hypothetical protein ACWDXT_04530 [Streptomyces sp. NPDC003236]